MSEEYPFIFQHFIRFCPRCSQLCRVNIGRPGKCFCGEEYTYITEEVFEKIKPYYEEDIYDSFIKNKEDVIKVKAILDEYNIPNTLEADCVEQASYNFSEFRKENRRKIEEAARMRAERDRRWGITPKPSVQCPYCKSHNVKKISSLTRMMSTSILGMGSGKIGKQWHCNDCKSDF